MTFKSPYSSTGMWLRGNLHTHTTESDGKRDPQTVIDDYAERGYDFLMISDHDMVTDPDRFDGRGLTFIPGNEVTARGGHILHVGASTRVEPVRDRQEVLDAIDADGGFAVMAHPNWHGGHNHWAASELAALDGYLGIEVYNGVIRRLAGKEYATDRWDILLSAGRKVWGFAHDDSHEAHDVERGWLMVQTDENTPAAILKSIRAGRFYASTGVEIETIALSDEALAIRAPNADRMVVLCDKGRRVHESDGGELGFEIPSDNNWSYVRVECFGPGEAFAWTQPFFRA